MRGARASGIAKMVSQVAPGQIDLALVLPSLVEILHLAVEKLQMAERVADQEALVICEAVAGDGSRYLRNFDSCLLFASSAI